MAETPIKILNLTSSTTPALVTTDFKADPTYGEGFPCGRPGRQQIPIRSKRGATSMTAVKFRVEIAWTFDETAAIWIPVLTVRLGDSTGVPKQEHTLSVNSEDINKDVLVSDSFDRIPLIRVVAEAVGANASTDDGAAAWVYQ